MWLSVTFILLSINGISLCRLLWQSLGKEKARSLGQAFYTFILPGNGYRRRPSFSL
ncbi:hypothetical protein [Pontibacter mucosus]|uniref:hypothetical protein n=1 Tax=Pontibacter mucosus TaxID=1649266 RepID=UPI001472D6DF|nr:hypothetical protein [Pontibacter mucosus]